MIFVVTGLFLLALLGCLGLHVFGLPGNWLLLGLVVLWALTHPELGLGWPVFALLGALAVAGEVVEFVIQLVGARRHGASLTGNLGGVLGALVGAVVGVPFLFGLGALLGAVAGAYLGCYVFERLGGRDDLAARQAAKGAFFGKIFGLSAKMACGAVMWMTAARAIWPA